MSLRAAVILARTVAFQHQAALLGRCGEHVCAQVWNSFYPPARLSCAYALTKEVWWALPKWSPRFSLQASTAVVMLRCLFLALSFVSSLVPTDACVCSFDAVPMGADDHIRCNCSLAHTPSTCLVLQRYLSATYHGSNCTLRSGYIMGRQERDARIQKFVPVLEQVIRLETT